MLSKISMFFNRITNMYHFQRRNYPALGSLSSHAPNWFLAPLALQETWGGLDLTIFRVLGVRQNSHINTLEYSGINPAIQIISAHAGADLI